MTRWGLGIAALALASGCGLDLTGSAEAPASDDGSADVWAPPDAPGGASDSAAHEVVDATADTASLAPDGADGPVAESSSFVADALDEADSAAPDAAGPDAIEVDTGSVDATGSDASGGDAARADAAGADAGGSDAAGADSARGDASAPPDASCAGVFCNGVCTTDTDCHACSGATLLCAANDRCLADCATCGTATTACYACDIARANPVGTCGDPDAGTAYCLVGAYAYHCGCSTVADCPGATQVCAAPASGTAPPNWCFTCGEAIPMATGTCKDGKTCDPTTGKCL
jgi:large repetitive protein